MSVRTVHRQICDHNPNYKPYRLTTASITTRHSQARQAWTTYLSYASRSSRGQVLVTQPTSEYRTYPIACWNTLEQPEQYLSTPFGPTPKLITFILFNVVSVMLACLHVFFRQFMYLMCVQVPKYMVLAAGIIRCSEITVNKCLYGRYGVGLYCIMSIWLCGDKRHCINHLVTVLIHT